MSKKITWYDLRAMHRRGEIVGDNDTQMLMSYVKLYTAGGDRLRHEELWQRARALRQRLAEGKPVSAEDVGAAPDISAMPGRTPIEQARNFLESTVDGFDHRPEAEQLELAQELLDRIAEADGDDVEDDGTELSAHAQAIRNLERRDPDGFGKLPHDKKCFRNARTNREAERIMLARSRRNESPAPTGTLADAQSAVAPPRAPVSPQPGQDEITLEELRSYPGANDTVRAIELMRERQPSFEKFPWDQQVKRAADLVRAIHRANPADPLRAGGAR